MKKRKFIGLRSLFLCIFLLGCQKDKPCRNADNAWVETIATITSTKITNEEYNFIISYEASESTAINKEGKKINGTIQQYGMSQKKPIDDQKLRLKYMKEEPVIFELSEPMQFEK
jgi:hypothetical protein